MLALYEIIVDNGNAGRRKTVAASVIDNQIANMVPTHPNEPSHSTNLS